MPVARQSVKTSSPTLAPNLRPIHPHLKPLIRAALDAGAHGASGAPGKRPTWRHGFGVKIGPDDVLLAKQLFGVAGVSPSWRWCTPVCFFSSPVVGEN